MAVISMLWVDLEMTGLDPKVDSIIEIASLVTDDQLNIIEEGPELVVHLPSERFQKMDQWNQEHHTKSGLWEKVLSSNMTLAEAEERTLDFARRHFGPNQAQLAGNSIWQDRRFITEQMVKFDQYLHYRMIDVSTVKLLCKKWFPQHGFRKRNSHRALEDIKESVNELKFYREMIFVPN